MNQEAVSIPCNNQESNASNSHLASILEVLPFIPFELVTLLAGKTTRPFIQELTDISASHLRRGKSYVSRKSTISRANENATEWSRKHVIGEGWSEEEWNLLVELAPSSIAGEPRPFADLIHCFQLPQATAFAEEIDLTVIKLLDSYKSDDLESFKRSILECDWIESVASQREFGEQLKVLRTSIDWDAALAVSNKFLFDVLLCYFAALDAEFGLVYFGQFQSRPIFTFVMPKLNAKADLSSLENIPKRNFIYQPVRRLLELTHALMVLMRDQSWPKKPVGRKLLGEALDLLDQEVGNYFDGTRNMNAKLFVNYWVKMHQTVANREPCASPLPLLLAALFWQSTITRYSNQKLKSFILPDKEKYTHFWKWHHQRWGSQLNKGTVGWPAWLND